MTDRNICLPESSGNTNNVTPGGGFGLSTPTLPPEGTGELRVWPNGDIQEGLEIKGQPQGQYMNKFH